MDGKKTSALAISMNLLGAPTYRRPVGRRKPEPAGGTPALPGTAPRFIAPVRVQSWRSKLPMNHVAADVSPLHLVQSDVRADSRRLLRFRGSKREIVRRNLSWEGGIKVRARVNSHSTESVKEAILIPRSRHAKMFCDRPAHVFQAFAEHVGANQVAFLGGQFV